MTSTAYSSERVAIWVTGITPTEREGVIDLNPGARLDCMSFLHGITLKSSPERFFYLHEDECYQAYDFFTAISPEGNGGCLILDFSQGDFRLTKNQLDCR
jgi:hypothetical protein